MVDQAVPSPPSGTVAFLFTDIEGSTKRWQADPEAMGAAVAHHDALLRAEIERRGGYVFKTVGDAFCAAFATVPLALAAALAAQRALDAADWGKPGPIRVRMAAHVGAAEEREADYFGPAVNRVARLLSAGHGGQVLLSLPAAELVRDSLPAEVALRDLGEHRLKDLARPERIFQLDVPDLPADFPPLVTLDYRPNNLPPQLTPLVGRDREVADVVARLERPDIRLVTLTGPGGTGKTRLSLQVTAEVLDTYPDGAWFVPLEEATDEGRIVAGIAQTLGVREAGSASPQDVLLEYLRPKTLLLVLDNFEQVVHAAPLVATLLLAAANVKVLVSSRVRLGIRGEHEYRVPPLGLPPSGRAVPAPAELSQYEAVRLFLDRAQAVKAGFELTPENAAAVAQICTALDGLPLAIELAAARVRLLPPAAMLRRLEDRLSLLVGGGRDRPERHQTLRGAIAWSHDLLPDDQRSLFARLSVFAGGFDLEAAEAVTSFGDEIDLLSTLEALVDHSLVRQEETIEGEPRFTMLATIRAFAREQLERASGGEVELMRLLHAEHYLAVAEQAEPELTGSNQVAWLERLAAEHDNLRTALGWCTEEGEVEQGLRLAGALWRFWFTRGHLTEGRRWLEQTLARGEDAAGEVRAKAANGAGVLAELQGDYDRAGELYREALALYRQAANQPGQISCLLNLGMLALVGDADYQRAERLYGDGLALARQIGNQSAVGVALAMLGNLALATGQTERAGRLWEESLALARSLEDRQAIALALANLGDVRRQQGNLEGALALLHQALPLFQELGDTRDVANVLGNLGRVALARGDLAESTDFLGESLALAVELGDRPFVADCLERSAMLALAGADAARAARLFGAAEALREALGTSLSAGDLADHERSTDAVRAALGEPAFAAAWEAGGRANLDEAVAEATALRA